MLRSIGAVVAGVVFGGILVAIVEYIGVLLFPLPAGVDPTDSEALAAIADSIPVGAQLFVLLAWAVGALAGGWLAARLAPSQPLVHALIVGAVLMVLGIINLVSIPSPLWFWIVGLLLFLPAAYVGGRLASGASST
jgi:hypothetical protein